MGHEQESSKHTRRNRKEIAVHLADFEKHLENKRSQRDASVAMGIPRSTLRHWKNRKDSIPIAQSVIQCLESPDGADFLHLLIVALEFVMIQLSGCGIRMVSLVLKLTHLHHFVAGSYESLRRRSIELENNINAYGKEERHRRSESMSYKKISVAEDETFHPQTCLVAIEPASNFILLEKYSEKRDAASWNTEMDEALYGLNVDVIQSTSDEAKGIVNHAEKHLGAHHSPDIFHVQHDISKGCSAPLALKTRHAQKEFDQAVDNLKSLENAEQQTAALKQFQVEAEQQKIIAEARVAECKKQEGIIAGARRGIGHDYHPYDLKSGRARDPDQLENSLNKRFDLIEKTVKDNDLRESAVQKVEKARRVIPGLVKTLTFYWAMINVLLESAALTAPLNRIMKEILIPAEYLFLASKKGKGSASRKEIYRIATELLGKLENEKEWLKLDQSEKDHLKKIAKEGASYFQRSSSCVEGRNGYLSLRRHGLHRLSNRKISTLTVIHNYFIKRPDGSTAADRFFGGKGRDLFEYLLENMPYPGRSGQRAKLLSQAA